MYAVIKTGGKQYKVAKDDILTVEKLSGEAGDAITFDQVLMIGEGESVKVGAPMLEGAAVSAELVEQTRGDKVLIFKKKRRKNYQRLNGHRQDLTTVKITEIAEKGAKKAAAKKAAPKEEVAEEKAVEAPKKTEAKKTEAKSTEVKKAAPKKAAAPKKPAAKKAPAKKPAAKKAESSEE